MSKLWQTPALFCLLLALTGCPPPPQAPARITPIHAPPAVAAPPAIQPAPQIPARTETVAAAPEPEPTQTVDRPQVVEIPVPAEIPGPAAPPPGPELPSFPVFQGWIPLQAWSEANSFGKPVASPKFTFDLQTTNWSLSVTTGSRLARFNGLNIGLGFPPQLNNRQALIHALDAAKTFQPLLLPFDLPVRNGKVIMIDPGHGGENRGAKCADRKVYEKDLALDWAFRLANLLSTNGWTVHLTRTNDVEVSLADRVAMADRVGAGLFVSLHFNSVDRAPTSGDEAGLETFCLTPLGMPSNLTRDYEDDPRHLFPNNAFDTENLQLAYRIHREMLAHTGRRDRGVRRARFMSVLRDQNRPAVLIEGGFLSNRQECRMICDPAYRQKMAEAVFSALCR